MSDGSEGSTECPRLALPCTRPTRPQAYQWFDERSGSPGSLGVVRSVTNEAGGGAGDGGRMLRRGIRRVAR
jgi:hypothetical protein